MNEIGEEDRIHAIRYIMRRISDPYEKISNILVNKYDDALQRWCNDHDCRCCPLKYECVL